MNRRGFLGTILALGAAPAVVRASSLMKIIVPPAPSILVPAWETIAIEAVEPVYIRRITYQEMSSAAIALWSAALREECQKQPFIEKFLTQRQKIMYDLSINNAGEISG